MLSLYNIEILPNKAALAALPKGKLLINTINAHSYNVAQEDALFAEALQNGDVLLADGASIVHACRWLKTPSQPTERIAGYDLFEYEMQRLEQEAISSQQSAISSQQSAISSQHGSADREKSEVRNQKSAAAPYVVMFMGSSEHVLQCIKARAALDYPHLQVLTYSPPYKPEFSQEDNAAIINAINAANPDLLWIGMTAPKQEKWTYSHWHELNIHCHAGTIGAVFDFYAGTAKRAPLWWQQHSLEWLYRLIMEPKRMWRRYIIGNALFIRNVLRERAAARRQ